MQTVFKLDVILHSLPFFYDWHNTFGNNKLISNKLLSKLEVQLEKLKKKYPNP